MSLIEVMIGLTAGLVLIGALAYFFLGSRQANRTHEDVSRMQESGRVGLEILGRAIRQAGARANVTQSFADADPAKNPPMTLTEGGGSAPDAITVRYDVQDGGEADCLGTVHTTGRVTYVFAVDTTNNTLTCTNETGDPVVVVMDNVENMQITYGIDGNHDGSIEAYQSATGLDSTQAAAVRVSLLVRGPTSMVAANKTQTYTYNGALETKTDGFLRQVYTSTFTVRNQAH